METSRSAPEKSTDDAILARELRQAGLEDRAVPASVARLIASRWHGGQSSDLYAFQSTGAISYGIADELVEDFGNPNLTPDDRRELDHLLRFIGEQEVDDDGERGPVENWHQLTRWDMPGEPLITESGYDGDNECIYCGAHISEAHFPGCVTAIEDGDA